MKLLTLTTLTLMVSLGFTQKTWSQNFAGIGINRPSSINGGEPLSWIFNRINQLDISMLVRDMEDEGVNEKKFHLRVSAQGALIQNDLLGVRAVSDDTDLNRDEGLRIIPFDVRLLDNGKAYIRLGAFEAKEMVNQFATSRSVGDFWSVVDSLEALYFVWDKNFTNSELDSFQWTVIKPTVKFNLLAKDSTDKLYLFFGGELGGHTTNYKIDNRDVRAVGGKHGIHAGIGFNKKIRENFDLKLSTTLSYSHMNSNGETLSPIAQDAYILERAAYNALNSAYQSDLSQWNADKVNYEIANNGAVVIPEADYIALTGAAKPVAPTPMDSNREGQIYERITRDTLYLQPRVEFSVNLRKDQSAPADGIFPPGWVAPKKKHPMRLGVKLHGNIPLRQDIISSDSYIKDITSGNRQLIDVGLFLNF